MLVLFRFKNFGPFRDEVTLDMRAVKSYKEHQYNLISETSESNFLKVVSIFGANASGKSNFIDAYSTFQKITRHSFQENNKDKKESFLSKCYNPFMLDVESVSTDTEFEAVYHEDNYEFRYGFSYNKEKITSEWLYRTSLTTNRQSTIIERSEKKISLGSSVKQVCEKYTDNIDVDVLALSFFSSLKLKNKVFENTLFCVLEILPLRFDCGQESAAILNFLFDETFEENDKDILLEFLNAIDIGIKDISVEKNEDKNNIYTYHFDKQGNKVRFPLEKESAGTRKAMAVFGLVKLVLVTGRGLLIDELNNQLHPLLQKYIVDLFYNSNSMAQLIYTTHDTTLLDKQYVRRDQVWFTDKSEYGEATLYSLADYKIRNDRSFTKDYLSGVFDAIPNLKKFDRWRNNDGN